MSLVSFYPFEQPGELDVAVRNSNELYIGVGVCVSVGKFHRITNEREVRQYMYMKEGTSSG